MRGPHGRAGQVCQERHICSCGAYPGAYLGNGSGQGEEWGAKWCAG
jgi:hypothetical protein